MSTIIAGRFELQEQAEEVITALENAGFSREGMTFFYVNPDGQHDIYPIGGDANTSPGARDSGKGAATAGGLGGAAGMAVGIAASPVVGPLGVIAAAGVGAYTGSLVGAVSSTDKESEVDEAVEEGEANPQNTTERKAGIHVAVRVDEARAESRQQAIDLLRAHGAVEVEQAQGQLEQGHWTDFDPREVVTLV